MAPWKTNPGFNTFQNIKIKENNQRRAATEERVERTRHNPQSTNFQENQSLPLEKPQKSSKIPLIIIFIALALIGLLTASLFQTKQE